VVLLTRQTLVDKLVATLTNSLRHHTQNLLKSSKLYFWFEMILGGEESDDRLFHEVYGFG
jgi:hypothetical protein